MQKGAMANMYRYMREGFRQKGFLIPFFAPFGIHNLIHSLQSKTLALFTLSHKQLQVCLLLPEFPSLRPGFFCTHRTDVVSLLRVFNPIFCTFWHSQPHPFSTKKNPSSVHPLTQATPSLPTSARFSIA